MKKTPLVDIVLLLCAFAALAPFAWADFTIDSNGQVTFLYRPSKLDMLAQCRGAGYDRSNCGRSPDSCSGGAPATDRLPATTNVEMGRTLKVCLQGDTDAACEAKIAAACANQARKSRYEDPLNPTGPKVPHCAPAWSDEKCYTSSIAGGLCPGQDSVTVPQYLACAEFLDAVGFKHSRMQLRDTGRQRRSADAVRPVAKDDLEESP